MPAPMLGDMHIQIKYGVALRSIEFPDTDTEKFNYFNTHIIHVIDMVVSYLAYKI